MTRAKKGIRKFTEWVYTEKDFRIKVPVFVHDRAQSGAHVPDGEEPIVFQVKLEDPPVELEDSDINKLKVALWAALKGKGSLKWMPYLYIKFEGEAEPLKSGTGRKGTREGFDRKTVRVVLSMTYYDLAETADGQRYRRGTDNYSTGDICEGWPDVGGDTTQNFYNSKTPGLMRALVPDTPENRTALNKLVQGFDALIKAMGNFLSPGQAQQTLDRLFQLGSLQAPQALKLFELPGPPAPGEEATTGK